MAQREAALWPHNKGNTVDNSKNSLRDLETQRIGHRRFIAGYICTDHKFSPADPNVCGEYNSALHPGLGSGTES